MDIDLPAHCPACDAIFNSGFVVSNATDISFEGNKSSCPHCGNLGNVIDGTFDFVGNVLRVRAAPPETIQILQRLQAALLAASNAQTAEEAAQKATEILPEAKEQITKASYSGKGAIVALLLAAMTSCSQTVKIEGKLDFNHAIEQLKPMFSERSRSGSEPPKEASPRPDEHAPR